MISKRIAMVRGGHRENAGRKSEWLSVGTTRPIRVPELLADQILEIARKLDRGEPLGTKEVQRQKPKTNGVPNLEEMIELVNKLVAIRKTEKQITEEILSHFY